MSKLDPHADRVIELYQETRSARQTQIRLNEEGVEVKYETVRQWLKKNADKLPALRIGAGKPKTAKVSQLFGILDGITKWMPGAGIHPQWFHVFYPATTPQMKDAYLVTALIKFGVETSLKDLETTKLPLTRMREVCDLELYVLAYLLGRHAPLIGASEEDFDGLIRGITPMAVELKEIILRRNAIQVGKLRDLLVAAEANCRKEVESRHK